MAPTALPQPSPNPREHLIHAQSSPLPKSQEELQKEEARITFNKTLNGHYRHGKPGYERVGALFLTWEDDDMQCKATEVDALKDLFTQGLQYDTYYYQIPSSRWETGLFSKVSEFLHNYDSPQCLAVIYYGGHGYDGQETGNFKLAAKSDVGSSNDPAVFYQDLWTCMRWPSCDQFLIIDCCNAARAFKSEPAGKQKFEILSSAAEEQVVPSPRQNGSFTACLTTSLRRLIQRNPHGFSTSQLYREIYHHNGINKKPWLFDSARRDHGKIWLRPQKSTHIYAPPENPGSTHLNLTLRLQDEPDTHLILNQIALKLQYLPHVDQVRFENLYAPKQKVDNLCGFLIQAQKLRPLIRKLHARRRMKKIRQMLTEEDRRTFGRSFAKLLLEQGDNNPAFEWASFVSDRSNGDGDRAKSMGTIEKPLFHLGPKNPTWPSPRLSSSWNHHMADTPPSKHVRIDVKD